EEYRCDHYNKLSFARTIPNFDEEIRFTGTVTDKNPAEQVGAVWWDVTVEEIIAGPQIPCDILRVGMVISPPMGQIESGIGISDRVDVYGKYIPDCRVSLNDDSYYIKKIAPEASTLTPFGLLALVSALSAIAAVAIVRKRR
ncbi:MAG: hypothetical protein ACP5E9_07970, partial [Candidatus Methanospirareceae archaeon]